MHPSRPQSAVLARLSRYSWRTYAIPVLAVVTVWVLVDVFSAEPEGQLPEDVAQVSSSAVPTSRVDSPNPVTQERRVLPATQLPDGPAFTQAGKGEYRVVGKPGARTAKDGAELFRYTIEVEEGLNTAVYGGDDAFAAMVEATLHAEKGWTHEGRFGFEHVGPDEEPQLRIQLTSMDTTHKLCGNDIAMETSCFNSIGGRVVINESRWVRGAAPFEGDLGAYRQYLLNHEVGHGLGFASHEPCAKEGALAPVMMQQTLSLNNAELFGIDPSEVYEDEDVTCRPNPWPYPFA